MPTSIVGSRSAAARNIRRLAILVACRGARIDRLARIASRDPPSTRIDGGLATTTSKGTMVTAERLANYVVWRNTQILFDSSHEAVGLVDARVRR